MVRQPRPLNVADWISLQRKGVLRAVAVYKNRLNDLARGLAIRPERVSDLVRVQKANQLFAKRARRELQILDARGLPQRMAVTAKAIPLLTDLRYVKRWVQILSPSLGYKRSQR
jgi:hypothetical protein